MMRMASESCVVASCDVCGLLSPYVVAFRDDLDDAIGVLERRGWSVDDIGALCPACFEEWGELI